MTNINNEEHNLLSESTLVSRARLIRRRTRTGAYCEYLRRTKNEEEPLIRQILAIRLRHREEASEHEVTCAAGCSSAQYIPSVDFAYPTLDADLSRVWPTPLFFPDFTRYQEIKNEAAECVSTEHAESFTVTLTNEKGERTFAYCFKFLSIQPMPSPSTKPTLAEELLGPGYRGQHPFNPHSVLVLFTSRPNNDHETLLHRLAFELTAAIRSADNEVGVFAMCRELLRFRPGPDMTRSPASEPKERLDGVQTPTIGRRHERSHHLLKLKHRLLAYPLGGSTHNNHQWNRFPMSTTIRRVGLAQTALVYFSLLAEKRILITGNNVGEVSRAVQTFVRLLAPLAWPHTLIPILPDCYTELCHNPTPYICGVLRYNLGKVGELLCSPPPKDDHITLEEEVTVLDVELGVILPHYIAAARQSLPLKNHDNRPTLKQAVINHCCAMGFPRASVIELLHSLKMGLAHKDPAKADREIEKAIMVWYAQIFGHYRHFYKQCDLLAAKNKKCFIKAHPCREVRPFLRWFIEGGMLQAYISQETELAPSPVENAHLHDSKIDRSTSSSSLSSTSTSSTKNPEMSRIRFNKVLEKHAPPPMMFSEKKRGKRTKARALVWRLLKQ